MEDNLQSVDMSARDKSRGMDETTYLRILNRQSIQRFLSEYQASIRATKAEAPSISYAIQTWSKKNQRFIHCLSNQEAAFVEILEYHPDVVEYMEQHMLPNDTAKHPLADHPLSQRTRFPQLKGVIATALDMDARQFLPRFFRGADGYAYHGLWIGDFLVVVRDQKGIYAVNFSIKATREDFGFNAPLLHQTDGFKARMLRNAMRHRIEKVMFEQAGISTHFIAVKEELSACLVANLNRMRGFRNQQIAWTPQFEHEVLEGFRTGIEKRSTPYEIFEVLTTKYQFEMKAMNACFQHLMWTRQLRVDLGQQIVNNRRLHPEKSDPLINWNQWFRRS